MAVTIISFMIFVQHLVFKKNMFRKLALLPSAGERLGRDPMK